MTQEPFAIEEDGFGTFALKAEVSFLDHIVTLDYELILFDRSKLHAFRSVRLDPGKSRDEWAQLVNLGGVRSSIGLTLLPNTITTFVKSFSLDTPLFRSNKNPFRQTWVETSFHASCLTRRVSDPSSIGDVGAIGN